MRRWDRLLDTYMDEYRARRICQATVAATESRLQFACARSRRPGRCNLLQSPQRQKYISRCLKHLQKLAPPPPAQPALHSRQVKTMASHRQPGLPFASTTPAHSLSAAQAAQKTEIKKVQHGPSPGIGHSAQPLALPQFRPRLVIRRILSAGQAAKKPEDKKAHMQHMQPIPKSDAPAPPCTSSALLFSTDP
jgi:hypothetical protein